MFEFYLACKVCKHKAQKRQFLSRRPVESKGDAGAVWKCPKCGTEDPRDLIGSKEETNAIRAS